MKERISYENSFADMIQTSAELVVEAQSNPGSPAARAAILYSTFLIEAAANCCLHDLKLPVNLAKELDKLPTLTKFEVYLLTITKGNSTLDRGAKSYQEVRELKKLRDATVHPKNMRVTWTVFEDESEFAEYPSTTQLGISLNSEEWSADDALNVFKAANAFLDEYFRVICNLKQEVIRRILLVAGASDVGEAYVCSSALMIMSKIHKVSLDYISISRDDYRIFQELKSATKLPDLGKN